MTGSFKVRGACFKIAQLTEEEKSHGVEVCSAGNHAQGVALAATAHGIKSLICLPDNAPSEYPLPGDRTWFAEIRPFLLHDDELVDKPGQLQHVSEIIASTGANVVSVYHERGSHTADINGCYLRLEMETRNQQQINEIRQLLTVSGYKIVEG